MRGYNPLVLGGVQVKRKIIVLISIIVVSILFIYGVNSKTYSLFENDQVMKLDFKQVAMEEANGETKVIYKTFFDETTYDQLVIYRINADSYQCYMNNILIGQVTKYEKQYGKNISEAGIYDIPEQLLKGKNELKIIISINEKNGLSDYPIVLTNQRNAFYIKSIINIFYGMSFYVLVSIITIIVILFLVFALFYEIDMNYKKYYLLAGISLLGIYMELFNPFVLGISFLTYKKLLISSFWLTIIFLDYGFYKELELKSIKYVANFSVILLLSILISPTFQRFNAIYNVVLPFMFMINITMWFYIAIKYKQVNRRSQILIYTLPILFVYSTYDIFNHIESRSYNSFLIYAVIAFLIAILISIAYEYFDSLEELKYQRKIADQMYEKAIRDSLTNSFTYEYMKKKLSKRKDPYALILLDIDNFKQINDLYGHQMGDRILKKLVEIINEHIGQEDILARYGGDEFLISTYDLKSAETVGRRIFEEYEKLKVKDVDHKFSLSMGITILTAYESIEEVFNETDQKLLKAKRDGKSGILI